MARSIKIQSGFKPLNIYKIGSINGEVSHNREYHRRWSSESKLVVLKMKFHATFWWDNLQKARRRAWGNMENKFVVLKNKFHATLWWDNLQKTRRRGWGKVGKKRYDCDLKW
jgi:hypothetical protein